MENRINRALVAVFADRADAERSVSELEQAGFSESEVGIMGRGAEGAHISEATTHAEPKGGLSGLGTGAVVGGIVGAVATGLIPGIGPIIGGGILAGVVGGAVAGGALGAVAGTLAGMGVPDEEAKGYEEEVKSGRWLVTCQAPGREQAANEILTRNGGRVDPSSLPEDSFADTRTEPLENGAPAQRPQSGPQTMRFMEERATPVKEQVQTGEVTLGKRVETETREIDVPVSREQVTVERRAVDEPRPATPQQLGQPSHISVPVMEEQVHIDKQPFVREEVTLKKERVEDTRRVQTEVKREEPEVDAADGSAERKSS